MNVHIDTLQMIVRRLASQMPVRYYLYAGPSDNPCSRMRLELWWLASTPIEGVYALHAELEKYGFDVETKTQSFELDDGTIYIIRTYIADREGY